MNENEPIESPVFLCTSHEYSGAPTEACLLTWEWVPNGPGAQSPYLNVEQLRQLAAELLEAAEIIESEQVK